MKNKNKKIILALTLITAGSVFCVTSPSSAKGLELEGVQIVFGRHHYEPTPPPQAHHHRHMPPPPPPHFHQHHPCPPRGPEMWAQRPGARMPEGHGQEHENFRQSDRNGARPEPPKGQPPRS